MRPEMHPDRLILEVVTLFREQRRVLAYVCEAGQPVRASVVADALGLRRTTVHQTLVALWRLRLLQREDWTGDRRRGSRPLYYRPSPGVAQLSRDLPVLKHLRGTRPRAEVGFRVLCAVKTLGFNGIWPSTDRVARCVQLSRATSNQWMRWLKAWGLWPLKDAA